MLKIAENLQNILGQIRQAEQIYHREIGSVKLLAVSKNQSSDAIRAAALAGQYAFGENYLQEALSKMCSLTDLTIEWHFIGSLQTNKTQGVAENFAWVHSIDRLKIAERLSQQRPSSLPALNVCIEVNLDQEVSKSGVALSELRDLAHAVSVLPRLRLRGLMVIPKPVADFAEQRRSYQHLRDWQQQLLADGLALDTLSMGMSNDFVAAIAEGSTMVRIGTAIFGPRRNY